jgi:hypothetical protein
VAAVFVFEIVLVGGHELVDDHPVSPDGEWKQRHEYRCEDCKER